jgi:hypothetical protein
MIKIITLSCLIGFSTISFGQEYDTTLSVYQNAVIHLNGGKRSMYKYGSFQPRDLHEAFYIFLTGDSTLLSKFKMKTVKDAVEYALERENNLFRFDWGQEGFFHFSKFCIDEYELYSPSLQNEFAIHVFYYWINEQDVNLVKTAKKIKKSNKKQNKEWKNRYKEFLKTLNKSNDEIWKQDKLERELEKEKTPIGLD